MKWDTNNSNDWTRPADLMAYLNPSEVSNANIDGEYWENALKQEAKNMIEKTTWHLGGFDNIEIATQEAYTYERGNVTYENSRPTTWEGYVGLMYPSDYGYAASEECMTSKTLYDYNNSICTTTNWLFLGTYEWLLSPYSSRPNGVCNVYNTGYLRNANYDVSRVRWARPVINLKSEVKIIDGTGDPNDPYILELN